MATDREDRPCWCYGPAWEVCPRCVPIEGDEPPPKPKKKNTRAAPSEPKKGG